MGLSRCTNRPVIVRRRLEWDGGVTETFLRDEKHSPLYKIARLYGDNGRALRNPKTGFGFQYQVTLVATGEVLGTDTYLGCAKDIAEKHFAAIHGGEHEGYWSSRELTRKLATRLGATTEQS